MNKQLIEVIADGLDEWEMTTTNWCSEGTAEYVFKAINNAGFVVVPKEPTEVMKHIGYVCLIDNCHSTEIYKAMIGSAQEEIYHVEKSCATCKHEQHVHCNSATDCVNNSLWEGK